MKQNRSRLLSIICLAVVALSLALLGESVWRANYGGNPLWPALSDVSKLAPLQLPEGEKPPQAVPSVALEVERDYAFRIGDRVPVRLYIRELPGTRVDLNSLALEGDFEIFGQNNGQSQNGGSSVKAERLEDGGRQLRVDVVLQSFSKSEKLSARLALSYRVLDSNEEYTVVLPVIEVHTSNTWDGRDLVKDGKPEILQGWHLYVNSAVTLVALASAVWFYLRFRLYRSYRAAQWAGRRRTKRFVLARKRFDLVWAEIAAGRGNATHYEEIERVVRWLYDIETKTTTEAGYWFVYGSRGPIPALEVLELCDRVVYGQQVLNESENERIKTVFDQLVPQFDAEALAEVTALAAHPAERRDLQREDAKALARRVTAPREQ